MIIKRVHVIVNPASGQDKPILKTLEFDLPRERHRVGYVHDQGGR